MTAIDGPGIYDLPEADYLNDPVTEGSLSASGAKLILDCPAKYRHRQTAGQEHKDHFDFGKAAHGLILGAGADVVVFEFDTWRTKDAQQAKKDAQADGAIPMLAKDWTIIQAMADQIRAHPIAAALLNPERGRPEQSLVWHDRIWRRARLDWLPDQPDTGRIIVPDYKTAADASATGFAKAAANYGYHQQASWYLDGVRALLGVDDAAFVFIVQEKDAPYVVNVVELTADFLAIGEWRNEVAVSRYIECSETGVWPGYATDVQRIPAPRWLEIEHEQQIEMQQEGYTP
jgi:hypothetical protein